jgi:hypothetical protein
VPDVADRKSDQPFCALRNTPQRYSLTLTSKSQPVPEQRKALRRMQKFAAEGLSPYKIAPDLEAHRTPLSHFNIRK